MLWFRMTQWRWRIREWWARFAARTALRLTRFIYRFVPDYRASGMKYTIRVEAIILKLDD